jgi:hypothetical protein
LNGKVEMARRAGYRPRGRVRRMYVQEARGFVWVIDITRSR